MCKTEPGFGNHTCLCKNGKDLKFSLIIQAKFLNVRITGFMGTNCDVTIDPCTSGGNPCENNARCVALQQGRFRCECEPGWEGPLCDSNIDDCAELPCLLNANCTDLVNDFNCACPRGFTGKRCELKVDLCASATTDSVLTGSLILNVSVIQDGRARTAMSTVRNPKNVSIKTVLK